MLDFAYSFDTDPGPGVANNGNVAAIVNNRNPDRTQSFTYDELNRIKTARTQATTGQHAWGLEFGYDIWANLLSASVTQGSAPMLSVGVNTKNQINNSGFVYDAAGNLTADGSLTMTYDAENRMVSTNAGVSYSYDGDGKRVRKSNGKLYWYGMSALDAVLETDLAGNNPTEYVFFAGKRVARRDPNGAVFYYFTNHLGSTSVITNSAGSIVEESDYYPFGGERVVVNNDPNPYKFTSKERDTETGLDYFVARYYSSGYGRFLSPDEFTGGPVSAYSSNDPLPPGPLPYADITNPQSLNKYTYTYNNPLNYVDPDGHDVIDFLVGLGNAVVSNFALGVGRNAPVNSDEALGQTVGDVISVVGGGIEMVFGVTTATGGVAACGTGVLCLAGAPAAAAGSAIAVHGVGVAGTALGNLLNDPIQSSGQPGQDGSNQSLVGNNPSESKGRINTDLRGGHEAARGKFAELAKGQSVTRDPKTGHLVAEDGTRLRLNSDGTARIDLPAGPNRGKHETVHFNDPDKRQ